MESAVEGIYKEGVIKPLSEIELEDNTKVIITIKDNKHKKNISKYAGAWKNYRTFDGRTLDEVKEEIYGDRKYSTRKELKF